MAPSRTFTREIRWHATYHIYLGFRLEINNIGMLVEKIDTHGYIDTILDRLLLLRIGVKVYIVLRTLIVWIKLHVAAIVFMGF